MVFIGPYLRNMNNIDPNGWVRMMGDWTNLLLLLLVFIVNLAMYHSINMYKSETVTMLSIFPHTLTR